MPGSSELRPSNSSLGPAARLFITALGAGYSPIASGTAGSGVALLFYLAIPGFWNPWVLLGCSAIAFAIAVPLATRAEREFGKDPSVVVIDEVVGMWITLASPLLVSPDLLERVIFGSIGFLIFRAADIIKPFPANWFDRKERGWGIMMDDVVAGVYANILTHGVVLGLGLLPWAVAFLSR
jgi:phosphatidylglycerophosphatase A